MRAIQAHTYPNVSRSLTLAALAGYQRDLSMNHGPLAYHITFHTYGTWLHGADAGSVDPFNNEFDTPAIPPNLVRQRLMAAKLKHEPLTLDDGQRAIVERTIQEVCQHRSWTLRTVNVRTNHVHAIVAAGAPPERVMNDFKAYCTRRLVEAGLVARGRRVWSRHGSTRYLWDERGVRAACRYVLDGQGPDLPEPRRPEPRP